MKGNNFWWTIPLGLVIGGLLGLLFGILIDQTPLWMILGAGGGLVLGLAVGAALQSRQAA